MRPSMKYAPGSTVELEPRAAISYERLRPAQVRIVPYELGQTLRGGAFIDLQGALGVGRVHFARKHRVFSGMDQQRL
jgi:hypothetical protein